MSTINITGARVHNLKNVSLAIPKHKLIVITGLSGSGKSSLAFDTIYAEGQRRYAESLNSYARQFMDVQDKPDVDEITGLSPTIAIDQKKVSHNPRSTVGTATEIYDYLRLLFARLGTQYDPETNEPIKQYSKGEIIEIVRKEARTGKLLLLSPIIINQCVKQKNLLESIEQTGYEHVRINGIVMPLVQMKKYKFDSKKTYNIELVISKITNPKKQNIAHAVDQALDFSNGYLALVNTDTGHEGFYSQHPFSISTGKAYQPIEPRSFSFNSPYGACQRCTGLGYTLDVDPELIIPNPRLTLAEGAVQPWTRIVGNQNYYKQLLLSVAEAHNFSVDIPVKELQQKVMDIILYGTDGQTYIVHNKQVHYDGIVPNLIQRYAETDSEYIRKEIEQYMQERVCPVCQGKRLKPESLSVRIGEHSIADIVELTVEEAIPFFSTKHTDKETFLSAINSKQKIIAEPVAKEIHTRLQNLSNVGLGYLSINRSVTTLSGGEAQRIRLSTQLSTGLSDVIYILDEPSIGLHPRDNQKLIDTLRQLCNNGNTVIVVEHDKTMIEAADHVIDVGPGAGIYGGQIIAEGTPKEIKKQPESLTGQYLSGKNTIPIPKTYRKGSKKSISIVGAKAFNLKNITVSIPLAKLVCVTGVSGSGKSSLIIDILSRALTKKFYRAKATPGAHTTIKGISNIDKVISIDQNPIGRTPRSNPATYTGVFTAIRDIFASTPEACMHSMDAGKFSFNVKGGGRCEACAGQGYISIPMQFLSDVFMECPECEGKRYNQETLEIHYHGKTIADVLNMTIEESCHFFSDVHAIADKLCLLRDVGLGYLGLGQPATTLSGGEAQRIKLATELSRRSTGKTLYILDEPTMGLHFADIKRMLDILNKLTDKGNTVIIIEHNLDVIKSSDWIIDLGPDGGKKGGELVAEGTPQDIAKVKRSYTGQYLKPLLEKNK